MNRRAFFQAVSVLAFTVLPLRAAETHYLPSGAVDAVKLLPPPPAAGSAEDLFDRESAFRAYTVRTPEQVARGKDQLKLTIFHYAPAIGAWFQTGKFPGTEGLFAQVEKETKTVTNAGKIRWQRARPYVAEPARFPDTIEREETGSYPSGHATRGTVFALLLAELFPDRRDVLLPIGREAGWVRVQGGVHMPQDIYAGRVLGQALAQEFLRSPEFQRDLAAARAELALARR